MDPVVLATVTSAVTVLAREAGALATTEAGKAFASEAGKTLWGTVRNLLGWKEDPKPASLAIDVAHALQKNPDLLTQVVELLKAHESQGDGAARALVERIDAKKVVVVHTMNISGDFKM
jgi:hypothetical protein